MTYISLIRQFSNYTDDKVLKLLQAEKDKPGWTSSRAIFISALRQVATNKGIISSFDKQNK